MFVPLILLESIHDMHKFCNEIKKMFKYCAHNPSMGFNFVDQFWIQKSPFFCFEGGLIHNEVGEYNVLHELIGCIVKLLHLYVKPDTGVRVLNDVDGNVYTRIIFCRSNAAHRKKYIPFELIVECRRISYVGLKSENPHEKWNIYREGYEVDIKKRRQCRKFLYIS